MNKRFVITEYGKMISAEKEDYSDDYLPIPPQYFDEFKRFAETEKGAEVLKVTGGGNVLKAKNYVGLIQTRKGAVLEILPKVYEDDSDKAAEISRNTLISMLKSIRNLPSYKKLDLSGLKTHFHSLMEVFIRMFTDEVRELVRKGIKSEYVSIQENQSYLKGKIRLTDHIKCNIAHRERFFVEYDDYRMDIPENRLIKSTLKRLYSASQNNDNQQLIREMLFVFGDIPESVNIERDFDRCKHNRLYRRYELIMAWCEIFLRNKSLTPYWGSSLSFALLFPMELIFERYVLSVLRWTMPDVHIKGQSIYDFAYINRPDYIPFAIKPDMVIYKEKCPVMILDTKWKVLDVSNVQGKYGVHQSDLYQLFTYREMVGKKHDIKPENIPLVLIYPWNSQFQNSIDVKLKSPQYSKDRDGKVECFLQLYPFNITQSCNKNSNYNVTFRCDMNELIKP